MQPPPAAAALVPNSKQAVPLPTRAAQFSPSRLPSTRSTFQPGRIGPPVVLHPKLQPLAAFTYVPDVSANANGQQPCATDFTVTRMQPRPQTSRPECLEQPAAAISPGFHIPQQISVQSASMAPAEACARCDCRPTVAATPPVRARGVAPRPYAQRSTGSSQRLRPHAPRTGQPAPSQIALRLDARSFSTMALCRSLATACPPPMVAAPAAASNALSSASCAAGAATR
jgi:hypothetical protein